MAEKITAENILDKLKLHPFTETPAVCLVAHQEIKRLRDELEHEVHRGIALRRMVEQGSSEERSMVVRLRGLLVQALPHVVPLVHRLDGSAQPNELVQQITQAVNDAKDLVTVP
ncbi:MAG TPA: hypothetical protein VGG64_08845 [Pirellulales bacterium]